MIEPSARISRCRIPTALVEASSDRKEFEQTSSARWEVWCAAVVRTGRISCRTTETPEFAACHAASEPARPPPMKCIGRIAACHKAARRRQRFLSVFSEKGHGLQGPALGRRAGFPARLGLQDLAIRPKPGPQPNGAR